MYKIFYEILNKFDDAICLINSDKTVVFVNDKYCSLYEKKPEEILGKHYYSLFSPDEYSLADKRFEMILSSDEPVNFNWVIIKDNGEVSSVTSFNYKVQIDGNTMVVVKLHEVSVERNMELMLRQSEKLAHIGGWEFEVNTNKLRWSDEVFRIHEMNSRVVPDLDACLSFYEPDSREELVNSVKDAIDNFKPFDKCFKFVTQKGNKKWVRVSCRPESILGNTLRLYGAIQDVTEMIFNEQELNKLSLVARSTANGVIITNKDDRIEWINSGFTKMYGYTLDEVFNKKPTEILRGSKWNENITDNNNSPTESPEPISRELINYKKDGSPFWVHIEANPFHDIEGKFLGYLTITTDIDPIKQSEEQLRINNEELKKTNEELDQFVYSMSHDIRAPLTSVLGLISVARMETGETNQSNYISLIEKNVYRLDRLVKDIINYSQNARVEIQPEHINFQELLNIAIESSNYHPNFKLVRIESEISENNLLISDKHRLKIILSNLISNAIKYHDTDKKDPYIMIKITIDSDRANIKVSDNGRGIPDKIRQKIFKMFFSTDISSEGAGLGLYIVNETIKKLRGSIEYSSEIGIGTKFTVIIPNLGNSNTS